MAERTFTFHRCIEFKRATSKRWKTTRKQRIVSDKKSKKVETARRVKAEAESNCNRERFLIVVNGSPQLSGEGNKMSGTTFREEEEESRTTKSRRSSSKHQDGRGPVEDGHEAPYFCVDVYANESRQTTEIEKVDGGFIKVSRDKMAWDISEPLTQQCGATAARRK